MLHRKMILCALGMANLQQAREVYLQMSETNQKQPSTQFLLYKIALRCNDVELGIDDFSQEACIC